MKTKLVSTRTWLCSVLVVVLLSVLVALRPETLKPDTAALAGTWTSTDLPASFLRKVGVTSPVVSNIIFDSGGTFIARSFPTRSPHRLEDIAGKWTVLDPSTTPSGKWSLDLNGHFLQLKKRGSKLFLELSIDVLEDYKAQFEKQ